MKNKGVIFAIEIDPVNILYLIYNYYKKIRIQTLKKTIGKGGARNVKPLCTNFLETDPNDIKFQKVNSYRIYIRYSL